MPRVYVYENNTVELVSSSLTTGTASDGISDSLASLNLSSSSTPTSLPTPHSRADGNAAELPALPRERAEEEDRTPWMQELRKKRRRASLNGEEDEQTPMELLDSEVLSFVRWVRPTIAEHDFRKQVFVLFERVVQRLWPGAQVELFGSMITGLYLPHGGFDVVVHHDALHRLPTLQILRSLASALRLSSFAHPPSIELVSSAKVPLLKFRTSPAYGSYRFDVLFNGPKGPAGARESMRLLAECEGEEEGAKDRVRRLVLVFKALLDSLGLNEVKHGGLGGMSTFCLAVAFVQHHPRQPETSPGHDLLRFLRYYAFEFDYRKYAITTANGGGLLDKRVAKYCIDRDPIRLAIQHPVDLSRDLSSGSHEWKTILLHLADASDSLSAFLEHAAKPGFPPSSALQDLGIRFTPQVLAQRRDNRRLAAEGGMEEKVKTWVPTQVREDPALQRMRLNGFFSVSVSVSPTPNSSSSPSSYGSAPVSPARSNGKGDTGSDVFSPELARFASLPPPTTTAPNPQQHSVVHPANPALAASRAPYRPPAPPTSSAASSYALPSNGFAVQRVYGYPAPAPVGPTYTAAAPLPQSSSFQATYLPHITSPGPSNPSSPLGFFPHSSSVHYPSASPSFPSAYSAYSPSPSPSTAHRRAPPSWSSSALPPRPPPFLPPSQAQPPDWSPPSRGYGRTWDVASAGRNGWGR